MVKDIVNVIETIITITVLGLDNYSIISPYRNYLFCN